MKETLDEQSRLELIHYRMERLSPSDELQMSHDAARGCLFDFCGEKEDCVRSCVSPTLCPSCIAYLQEHGLPVNEVKQVQRELKRIRRRFYGLCLPVSQQAPIPVDAFDSGRNFYNKHYFQFHL